MTGREKARRKGLRRALLILCPLLVAAGIAVIVQSRATAAETPQTETIPFNHQKHLAAGAQCLYCHPGGYLGSVSGIPSVRKCIGCHENIQVTSEAGQAQVEQLFQVWESGAPLTWRKVVDLPDFVYFSHFPHIAAGKSCERCHGDVSAMPVTVQAYRINMGFCLKQCHRHEDAERRERLMDCATCHQ
jgi:hypothetical protein